MSNRKVKEEDIKKIIALSAFDVKTVFDKCTLMTCKLPSGFVLTASSGAVDKENYDFEIGKEVCLKEIENQLWKLEGYKLADEIYNIENKLPSETFNFGKAIEYLKLGYRVARKGWNGKDIFLELQTPDQYSKMTSPYIYIDSTNLETTNKNAVKNRVPWLASQTDMLADDWIISCVNTIKIDVNGIKSTVTSGKITSEHFIRPDGITAITSNNNKFFK